MIAAGPLEQWAHVLIDSLVQAGVSTAVICPGARSTPFAWAASQHPDLSCTRLIDERSAAYFALGRARMCDRPTLVVTTSGTAAANCLPAVVEARASATPLLVLTADRPRELQDCAAPQTIDQLKLFGDQARAFFELGLPDDSADGLRALRRKAAQAVLRARWPLPGAVHLNAPARKPLEPGARHSSESARLPHPPAPPTQADPPEISPSPAGLAQLARACASARHALLVCGPVNPARGVDADALTRIVQRSGMVVFAEGASQLRFALPPSLRDHVVDGYDLGLRHAPYRDRAVPDLVLQLGHTPVSTSLATYLRQHHATPRWVVAPFDWTDPSSSAAAMLVASVNPTLRALADALETGEPPDAELHHERQNWLALHSAANSAIWDAVERSLPNATPRLTEAQTVRETIDSLPRGGLLVLGNSLPIREVETYCRARTGDVRVCSQRGASGIDGVLSAAAGAAAESSRATTVLIGDVSFLHDIGGLWAARDLNQPFVVVVINNDGGRIFEQLPVAEIPGLTRDELDCWVTSHGLRLARAGDLFGTPAEPVNTVDQLQVALDRAHSRPGCTLVEARVGAHDAAELLPLVTAQVERELAPILGSNCPVSAS